MAVLCVEGDFAVELVLDAAAVAAASPLDVKVVLLVLDLVGRFVLPFVVLAGPGLELVAVVSVDFFGVDVLVAVLVLLGRHGWAGGSGSDSGDVSRLRSCCCYKSR